MDPLHLFVLLLATQLVAPPGPERVFAAPLPREARAVAAAADGSALAAATTDRAVSIWDLPAGKRRRTLKLGAPVQDIAFSPDGTRLATLATALQLWDTRRDAGPADYASVSGVRMAFAPNGRLAVGDYRVRLVDLTSGQPQVLYPELGGWQNTSVAYSPDGRLLAAGDISGSVWVLDAAASAPRLRRKGHTGRVVGVGFIDDGRTLVSAGMNGQVKLWDVSSGRQVGAIAPHDSGGLGGLACSFDGRTIVTGGAGDGTVKLWEAMTGKLRTSLRLSGGGVTSLALSRDGSTLVAGGKPGGGSAVAAWRLYRCPPSSAPHWPAIWQQLAGDSAAAYRAVLLLASHPREATAFLRGQLHPVVLDDAVRKECDALITALDSDRFDVRDAASRRLVAMSPWIEPYLRAAQSSARTLELQRRLQAMIAHIGQSTLPLLRAVEALEHAAGPEPRELLRALAAGEPQARITREARQALDRLDTPR